jgi:hypothetical protein
MWMTGIVQWTAGVHPPAIPSGLNGLWDSVDETARSGQAANCRNTPPSTIHNTNHHHH